MIITIDGPAASGKSTIASLLAQRTGSFYINSGLLFRALAFCFLKQKSALHHFLHDQKALDAYVSDTISYDFSRETGPVILYKGEPITALLKTPEIATYASIIAMEPAVRTALLTYQRELANNRAIVADGRDCGSIVFPHASYKFFITASEAVRAQRLQKEFAQRYTPLSLTEARALIHERDTRDETRLYAPLQIPIDAYYIDTSSLTIEETLDRVLSLLQVPKDEHSDLTTETLD